MLKKTTKIAFFLYQGIFGSAVPACRYRPTCSRYCVDAIEKYGAKGVLYALLRLLSCHPLSRRPLYDPA